MSVKAILTDVTKCIGCLECVAACKATYSLKMDLPKTWQKNDGLSASNWTSVLQKPGDHYVRKQCRHCLEPACVSACPVGALSKTPEGPVIYDNDKCLGCRYCMMSCPYGIPRYDWDKPVPYIRKCIMCYQKIQDGELKEPACTNACPTSATIFGDRDELIKEAVELTKTLWKDPAVPRKYRVNYIKGGKIFVKGQPSEIYEVMVNLIKNGLEAMPHGGFLTISAARQNGHIHLTVSDTGHGISEAHFQRIFEPFFTTKGSKSSGLGLSSCYGIVKKHQGEMHVKSILGQGTSFTIILPLAERPDVQERRKLVPIERHKLNLLVIDDEVNILKMMELFFEDTEVDIVTALTAEAGLHAIRSDHFDAILCDLGMDDINGLEVGQKVKEYCRTANKPKTPFLLYTGLEKELDPKKLSDFGIDWVVKKPIPCEDLLRLVHEISAPPARAKRTA